MRVGHTLARSTARVSLRSRMVELVAQILPIWVFRKLMESQFINFGIETTNICNANCTFCAYRFMERPKVVMPWEIFERAVTAFSQAGGGSINFTPTVGDPLVDKHLLKKIKFAARLPNIDVIFLYTNGILIDRFGFEEMLTSGISRLAISTYVGSRDGYIKYYGRDRYERVMTNIEQIARKNLELGSPVLITLHLRVSADQTEWRENEMYKNIASMIGEENIDFLSVYDTWSGKISKKDLPDGCEIDVPLSVEVKKQEPCFELYRRIHVLADGNVGACICTDLDAEINIGNLVEQSLDEIWKGDKLKRYRSEWVKGNLPEVCKSCTRYTPLGDFIRDNRKRIVVDYARRSFPTLFRLAVRKPEMSVGSQNIDI